MTDAEFLLAVLSDGAPHCLNEILRRSFAERGCGLTVHSRVSDLRKRGHEVSHWTDGERGNGSWYRLTLEQVTASPLPVACSSVPAGHAARDFPSDRDGDGAAGTLQLQIEATP